MYIANVIGAQNFIEACLDFVVNSIVALSTNKSAVPIKLYCATKLCSYKLSTAANNIKDNRETRLWIVSYCNVMVAEAQ